MRRHVAGFSKAALLTAGFLLTHVPEAAAQQNTSNQGPTCQVTGPQVRVPELQEGSGVAASRRSPGRLWAHNDSGDPVLVALDANGAVSGSVRVSGARVEDWEAIAGPCAAGACLYIGDIGDNDAGRRSITIYRVPEPADPSSPADVADSLRVMYPDGAQDAETLLVTPTGDMLIVTKGDTGPVALYRVPPGSDSGGTVPLQPIGTPRPGGKVAAGERITDGAVSPSGAWVALRTRTSVLFYRTDQLLAGNWQEAGRVSLQALGEPQGEGIVFGDEKTIYLVGEGGGKSQPGTFGRLTCAL